MPRIPGTLPWLGVFGKYDLLEFCESIYCLMKPETVAISCRLAHGRLGFERQRCTTSCFQPD